MPREIRIPIDRLRGLVEKGRKASSTLFLNADAAETAALTLLEMVQRNATKLRVDEEERVEADFGILGLFPMLQQPLLKIDLAVEVGRTIRDGLTARVLSDAVSVGRTSLSAAELQIAAREYGRRREAIGDAEWRTKRELLRIGRQKQQLLAAPTAEAITDHLSRNRQVLQRADALAGYRHRLESRIDRAYDAADKAGVPGEIQDIAAISGMRQAEVPDDHLKIDPNTLSPTTLFVIGLAEHLWFE